MLLAIVLALVPARALADTVSCGAANRGALASAVQLPEQGEGFVIPEPWRSRDLSYGTQELVDLIQRAAKFVDASHPGAILGVADMSKQNGGACPGHQSHQSGRDVDLLYYAIDEAGAPFEPDEHMPYYTSKGYAYYARKPVWTRDIPKRHFDAERNWALIKALIGDPEVEVEHIFVSNRIERWIIKHAKKVGEDDEIIQRARIVMRRPRDSEPHNDHMHIRVECSEDDVKQGRCRTNFRRRKNGKWRRRIRCPKAPKAES